MIKCVSREEKIRIGFSPKSVPLCAAKWGIYMANWHSNETDELCDALLSLETKEECYAFLEDLCTIKEVLDLSQRLSVAKMLSKGISYTVINTETGASTATISRVSKCCEYGAGGYKTVIARLGENKEQK